MHRSPLSDCWQSESGSWGELDTLTGGSLRRRTTGSATMRLVIFGPTGGTGRRLVERAIAEGHEVTALARNPSKMSARHRRLKVVVGDAFDPGQVREAVVGNEAVISVLGSRQPSNPLYPHRPGNPDGVGSAGTANIVAAMKEHGLRRFVCQ